MTAAADARWAPELGPAHRVRRVVWPSLVTLSDEWPLRTRAGHAA